MSAARVTVDIAGAAAGLSVLNKILRGLPATKPRDLRWLEDTRSLELLRLFNGDGTTTVVVRPNTIFIERLHAEGASQENIAALVSAFRHGVAPSVSAVENMPSPTAGVTETSDGTFSAGRQTGAAPRRPSIAEVAADLERRAREALGGGTAAADALALALIAARTDSDGVGAVRNTILWGQD